VLVLTQVIAEAIYVLGGVYKIGRPDIAAAFHKIAAIPTVQLENREIVLLAVDEYGQSNLDFVDVLLYVYNRVVGYPVESFDKDSNRKLMSGDSK
jgi:predicted nucleic-acid-binding protein